MLLLWLYFLKSNVLCYICIRATVKCLIYDTSIASWRARLAFSCRINFRSWSTVLCKWDWPVEFELISSRLLANRRRIAAWLARVLLALRMYLRYQFWILRAAASGVSCRGDEHSFMSLARWRIWWAVRLWCSDEEFEVATWFTGILCFMFWKAFSISPNGVRLPGDMDWLLRLFASSELFNCSLGEPLRVGGDAEISLRSNANAELAATSVRSVFVPSSVLSRLFKGQIMYNLLPGTAYTGRLENTMWKICVLGTAFLTVILRPRWRVGSLQMSFD